MSLEDILQIIYDSEINLSIRWLWDGGVDFTYDLNGVENRETVNTFHDLKTRLPHYIIQYLPRSEAAKTFRGLYKNYDGELS